MYSKKHIDNYGSRTQRLNKENIIPKVFNSKNIGLTNKVYDSIELNKEIDEIGYKIKEKKIDDILLEFVDFDDTLFPTDKLSNISAIKKTDFFNTIYPEDILKGIEKLEKIVIDFINLASLKGKLYILTAANESWVKSCIKKFYPNVHKYHRDKYIIISARDEHSGVTDDPAEWKRLSIIKELKQGIRTYILSIGDSFYEADASSKIHHDRANLVNYEQPEDVYIFKLIDKPSIKEIGKQLLFIIKNFDKLIHEYEFDTVQHIVIKSNKK